LDNRGFSLPAFALSKIVETCRPRCVALVVTVTASRGSSEPLITVTSSLTARSPS
jgi:hypothetical protein